MLFKTFLLIVSGFFSSTSLNQNNYLYTDTIQQATLMKLGKKESKRKKSDCAPHVICELFVHDCARL